MALLDKACKQRIVGALVLVALAVIFLPMLFAREDEQHHIQVDAPAAPQMPVIPEVNVEPVLAPELQVVAQESAPPQQALAPTVVKPAVAVLKPPTATPAKAVAHAPVKLHTTQGRPDSNESLVSWSVQLISLSSRSSAESLQKNLKDQGYNAYVRSSGGMNRVLIGPLLDWAEANRLCDLLGKQQNLKGFVVRFQAERS